MTRQYSLLPSSSHFASRGDYPYIQRRHVLLKKARVLEPLVLMAAAKKLTAFNHCVQVVVGAGRLSQA